MLIGKKAIDGLCWNRTLTRLFTCWHERFPSAFDDNRPEHILFSGALCRVVGYAKFIVSVLASRSAMNIKSPGTLIFSLLLSFSPLAMAAVQEHTFTITGETGETGTGSFTWDDSVVPDGSSLNGLSHILSPNVLSIHIEISGGSIVGGPIVFQRENCGGAILRNTPNFSDEINFWCFNSPYHLEGVDASYAYVNGGPSTLGLTFSPGVTTPVSNADPSPVPTLSVYGLILTTLGVLLVVFRRRLRQAG